MLRLRLYKIPDTRKRNVFYLLSGIILILFYYLIPEARIWLGISAIIIYVIIPSIAFKSLEEAGMLELNIRDIAISERNHEFRFMMEEITSLEIYYSGYFGKRLSGDWMPNYNIFTGVDNKIFVRTSTAVHEYYFGVESQECEQELMDIIEKYILYGYPVIFNSKTEIRRAE